MASEHHDLDDKRTGSEVDIPDRSLSEELKESFDPTARLIMTKEDSFEEYRDKTVGQQILTVLFYLFPILEWMSGYKWLEWLVGDIIAGFTITSLAVPQDLAYALLAKVPPVNGLYSSFVPPLVYSALGTSRHIAIGPTAVVSLLVGSRLSAYLDPQSDPETYLHLAFTATFFSGITQLTLGVLRLGFIIDYLSHAVVVGFMAGAAITIGLSQMKNFLGYKTFTEKTDIISVLTFIFTNLNQFLWRSFVIGTVFLIFLLTTKILAWVFKRKKPANKIFFFLNCLAPFTSVFIATLFVFLTGTSSQCCDYNSYNCNKYDASKGAIVRCTGTPGPVPSVTPIPKGVSNLSSINGLYLSGPWLMPAAASGIVIGLISLAEAIAIARTFAARAGYHINGDKEMMAYGLMNLAGSVTSSIATTGSFSRSSVNYQAGGNTMLTNIIMSIIIVLTLVAITDVFLFLPQAVLSAIIISAVVTLIDLGAMWQIWKMDKLDFLAMIGTFLGTIFDSVETGLLVGVIISMLRTLIIITRPHVVVLGEVDGTFQSIKQYETAETKEGILILRFDTPLYFTNANYIREKIVELARRYEKDHVEPLTHMILDLSAAADIDTTCIIAFEEAIDVLEGLDVQVVFANPSKVIIRKVAASHLIDKVGHHNIFRSVAEALRAVDFARTHRKETKGSKRRDEEDGA